MTSTGHQTLLDSESSLFSDVPRSALKENSRNGEMRIGPVCDASRDWEGFVQFQREGAINCSQLDLNTSLKSSLRRSVSPSVAVLKPAEDFSKQQLQKHFYDRVSVPQNRSDFLLDHQAVLELRRQEYKRRCKAEAIGRINIPFNYDYINTPSVTYANPKATREIYVSSNDDYIRSPPLHYAKPKTTYTQQTLPNKAENSVHRVVGTREEIAWLQPPPIPMPIGWSGYWDLCQGHESVLQIMALSGVNPDNSPSLTEHFMYSELLSAIQRLQYGTYCVHYIASDTPHERYFYIKALPLSNKGQFCPFFCWSVHRHSHNALDAIPLCNVIWVTQGIENSVTMKKYWIGGDYIHGPSINGKRSECLTFGALTVWIYDGILKTVDFLCPDPLVFTLWMKLLEDFAQLNAALDVTGNVRALQRDLENSRINGNLANRELLKRKKEF